MTPAAKAQAARVVVFTRNPEAHIAGLLAESRRRAAGTASRIPVTLAGSYRRPSLLRSLWAFLTAPSPDLSR